MKNNLLILSICIFTSIFVILNIPNIYKIFRMTFITPQLHAQASPVTRIRLVDRGHTYQDSFIAGSILTPDNRSVFFLFVPDTVDFITSQLFIKDKPVQLKQREHHTAFYEDQTRVVYILRATNQAEMISLITSENLHIVQPQRP